MAPDACRCDTAASVPCASDWGTSLCPTRYAGAIRRSRSFRTICRQEGCGAQTRALRALRHGHLSPLLDCDARQALSLRRSRSTANSPQSIATGTPIPSFPRRRGSSDFGVVNNNVHGGTDIRLPKDPAFAGMTVNADVVWLHSGFCGCKHCFALRPSPFALRPSPFALRSSPLTLCGVKQAEHRSPRRPKRHPRLSAASLGVVPLWAMARREPGQFHRFVAAPVADGFGYFCLIKSDPRVARKRLTLNRSTTSPRSHANNDTQPNGDETSPTTRRCTTLVQCRRPPPSTP